MAGFSDTIKLTVDVIAGQTQGFKGFLSGMKTDLGEAEGAFDKLKVAGSGAMDFVSQNATALALGAGAAIGGFAIKAVGDFQDIALEAGHLRDALGLSAEDASRWIEVAGDLGISSSTLETALGKMLKTAGSSPGVFEKLGVAIAHAKDGSVDANGTFLNVIDRLNGMKDPAERAAAAQQLLGKSWRDAAELIGLGADGVKAKLAEVSDAKIIGDSQVDQAKDLRDSLDDLKDSGEDLTLTLGRTLLPMLASLADAAGKIAGPVADLIAQAGDIADTGDEAGASFWDQFKGGIARSVPLFSGDGAWDLLGLGKEDIDATVGQLPTALNEAKLAAAGIEVQAGATGAAVEQMRGMFGVAIPTTEQMAAAQEASAAAAKLQADNQSHLDETMAGVNAKIHEQIDALNGQVDANLSAADATLALNDAQRAFGEAVLASAAAQADASASASQRADAVNAERDAMLAAADAARAKVEADAAAAGGTASATSKIDAYNASLLANAHFATPAAKQAIADYIVEANNVPAEKATDIRAAIAAGDFETAKRLLDEASRTREVALRADAQTASAEQAINNAARPRTVQIRANFTGGPQQATAIGGTPKPGLGVVGEYGPEVVDWSLGRPKVIPRAESANILGNRGGLDHSIVVNVNNNGRDIGPDAIARAIRMVQLAS